MWPQRNSHNYRRVIGDGKENPFAFVLPNFDNVVKLLTLSGDSSQAVEIYDPNKLYSVIKIEVFPAKRVEVFFVCFLFLFSSLFLFLYKLLLLQNKDPNMMLPPLEQHHTLGYKINQNNNNIPFSSTLYNNSIKIGYGAPKIKSASFRKWIWGWWWRGSFGDF